MAVDFFATSTSNLRLGLLSTASIDIDVSTFRFVKTQNAHKILHCLTDSSEARFLVYQKLRTRDLNGFGCQPTSIMKPVRV